MIKKYFYILCFCVLAVSVKAQSGVHWNYIYTLKIDSVTNRVQAKYATTPLRKISHTMRCDFNDSTYYFTIKSNADISKSDFITGLQQAGYDVSSGIHFSKTDNTISNVSKSGKNNTK